MLLCIMTLQTTVWFATCLWFWARHKIPKYLKSQRTTNNLPPPQKNLSQTKLQSWKQDGVTDEVGIALHSTSSGSALQHRKAQSSRPAPSHCHHHLHCYTEVTYKKGSHTFQHLIPTLCCKDSDGWILQLTLTSRSHKLHKKAKGYKITHCLCTRTLT